MGQSKLFYVSYDYRDHESEYIKHYNNIIKADTEDEVRTYINHKIATNQCTVIGPLFIREMKVVSYEKGVTEYNLNLDDYIIVKTYI